MTAVRFARRYYVKAFGAAWSFSKRDFESLLATGSKTGALEIEIHGGRRVSRVPPRKSLCTIKPIGRRDWDESAYQHALDVFRKTGETT